MSNYVEIFWRSKYAEPLKIDIDGMKFERMAMSQAQIDNVISNDDYEQALHDAADFGISYAGKRIYDNETMKAKLDELWHSEEVTADMRLQLGIEVAEISGISMDIGIIKSEQEEREAKELAAKQAELDEQVEAEANKGGSTVIFAETLPDEIPTHELTNFTEDE